MLPHRDPMDPMVTPMVRNVHPHLAVRQAGRSLPNEPPIGFISKRLDDMLSTPFCSHIIHYEPPRGFLVPKFSTYDGSNDPFDHIMHYRQLMTLDIGNDALLCKVFPASLQGQALSWFHRLANDAFSTHKIQGGNRNPKHTQSQATCSSKPENNQQRQNTTRRKQEKRTYRV